MIDITQMTTCIIVDKKLIGTKNQILAITERLGIKDFKLINASLKAPWKLLSPNFIPDCKMMTNGDIPSTPYPNLIIAAGRKAIPIARYIKSENPSSFVCFLQNPKAFHTNFDLIAAPDHDQMNGHNIIKTTGASNSITDKKLNKEKDKIKDNISNMPKEKIAFIIGGNSNTHKMTKEITSKLCDEIVRLSNKYGIMITASRRTGEENLKILKEKTTNINNCYLWDGNGYNPYISFLANADHIVVTNDSVSMISEACSTGKPVHIYELEGGSKKFEIFYKNLTKNNSAKFYNGNLEYFTPTKLNDAQIVADKIKEMLGKHLK